MFKSQRRRQAIADLETHVRSFFAGHAVTVDDYDLGFGRRGAVPGLRILTVSPGPRADSWAYVTAGCWSTGETGENGGHGLEFVLTAPARDERFADLLAMTAYYHADHRLDLGHSLPIGEPWLAGSHCDHLLISLPYLHGPGLEQCPLQDGHARILWLLPVTAAEMAYRREHGHDALEQLFDEQGMVPTDPRRPSVA
ncbi:suppressor of fused domain protein [Streptomyces xanthophaeus]|uniref:suppressor of fused domain protein n=1 Tax=Streptomyces xanthophaeus TaxID=67385 RepID=UPI00371D697A